MRGESSLLLALARLVLDERTLAECRALLAEHGRKFDWGYFIDRAARHRLLPLVGRHITRHRLFHGEPGMPAIPYHWVYEAAYLATRDRAALLAEEYGQVIDALTTHGPAFAVRKGPTVSCLYGDPGLRRSNDLDLLVDRADLPALAEVLASLGYREGWLDEGGTRLLDYRRTTRMFWQVNLPNALPLVKLANRELVESYRVDICFDIFPARSEASCSTIEMLAGSVPFPMFGRVGPALGPADRFIDLCTHLHKESTSLYYIENGSDLELLKFHDVALAALSITEEKEWSAVRAAASRYRADRSVYYALHHVSLLYPEAVPPVEVAHFEPADTAYLDEYGTFDGRPGPWGTPFLDRLFDVSRPDRVATASSIPLT
ncbi:nucleotidyltransferase family protein [Streptomyces sp. NPDC001351]|uniref:nucleotidyltransferase family protein n=1 Tax=Streptomyces sp. NPDC001351 TaxID=3364564 RepID=UPI003678A1DC